MLSRTIVTLVEEGLRSYLAKGFARAGMAVESTESSRELLHFMLTQKVDAIVADGILIQDQMKSIEQIRSNEQRASILVVLNNPEETMMKIYALEDGADVCFDKPVQIEELITQTKALFRRFDLIRDIPRDLTIKDIQINLNTHEVHKNGHLIDLTYTQFKLLYLLASQREVVFSRNDILKKVWGEHAYVTDRTVDVHVKRLREKLGEGKQTSKYIQTIHGMGYRLA